MAEDKTRSFGKMTWADITVPNADKLREFYSSVVGWKHEPVEMGGYEDYSMIAADGSIVAGVCHNLGVNEDLPAQWLVYITVENLDESIKNCLELGGNIVAGPMAYGDGRYCVIRDPAGAVAALYEPAQ